MVARNRAEQWSPTKWPVSFRWRLLAAALIVVATAVAVIALSNSDKSDPPEASVVATTQRWAEGHPPGEHTLINVPADLAVLFVHPSKLDGTVAAVDVPAGALVSPDMLRPLEGTDAVRNTALMRFTASSDLWPDPGPIAGRRAVFSPTPGGCAAAVVTLLAVGDEGADAGVTVEATPELAALLSDGQWWIWESPPNGWPRCEVEPSPTPADPTYPRR